MFIFQTVKLLFCKSSQIKEMIRRGVLISLFREASTATAARPAEITRGRMAALRVHGYGGLDDLRVDSVRIPAVRAPDDVLIRVHYASINPIDIAMMSGYGSVALGWLRTADRCRSGWGAFVAEDELPLTPGRDCIGEVVATGHNAKAKEGDKVWAVVPPHLIGSHAQYVLLKDKWVAPTPTTMGNSAAAVLYAALSASSAIFTAGVMGGRGAARGKRVLVLGAGPVGMAALQLLAYYGAEVTVGCSTSYHERVLSRGAAQVIDRNEPDYWKTVRDNGPYNVVLDCAGLGDSAAENLTNRTSVYVTLSSPVLSETDKSPYLGLTKIMFNRIGSMMSPLPTRWAYFTPSRDTMELLRRLCENGEFKVDVDEIVPYTLGPDAYQRAASPRSPVGKVLIDFTSDE